MGGSWRGWLLELIAVLKFAVSENDLGKIIFLIHLLLKGTFLEH